MQKTDLIDKYLPHYTLSEYHETMVNSPIEPGYQIAKDIDLSRSELITFLFKIRELPTKRLNLQSLIADIGFTNLEGNYPYENRIGFWTRRKDSQL